MGLKDQLEQAGYDTTGLDENQMLQQLDKAGYDVSSLAPSKPTMAQTTLEASSPSEMMKIASPSNSLKALGVASVNAPGAVGTIVNSLPGVGNPSEIVPSVMNTMKDLGQFGKALTRMAIVQGGGELTLQEKVPAYTGQAVGSALEAIQPGQAVKGAVEETAANIGKSSVVQALKGTGKKEVMALTEKAAELPLKQIAKKELLQTTLKEAGSDIGKAEVQLGIDKATGNASLRRAVINSPEKLTKFADRAIKLAKKGPEKLSELASPETLQFYRKTADDGIKVAGRNLSNEAKANLYEIKKVFADAIGMSKEEGGKAFGEANKRYGELSDIIKNLPKEAFKQKKILELALAKAKNLADSQAGIRKAAGIAAGATGGLGLSGLALKKLAGY